MKLPPSTPDPPEWLVDEIAVATWRELVPELDRLGLLARVDAGQLANYCQLAAHLATAEGILRLEGLTAEGQHQLVRHPAWVVAKDCRSQMLALARELYLTPVSRLRATMPPQDDNVSSEARQILD